MKEVSKMVYQSVHDVLEMPSVLNSIAKEHEDLGYQVSRGAMGIVILKLDDGEVHFVPAGKHIDQVLLEGEK